MAGNKNDFEIYPIILCVSKQPWKWMQKENPTNALHITRLKKPLKSS